MSIMRVTGSSGVELAVRVDGDPDSPPIVLLHALGETSESWAALTPELAKRYRVAAFDLRGHGASDWPGVYSTELMCADVLAAVQGLGFDRFRLIGHSLGGAVAILLAQRLGDRIVQLVLEDVVPPYPREVREVPEKPDEELPFDWALLATTYAEMSDETMGQWPALASITAPTLVVAGGPGSHIPGERIAEMAALIPDASVVTIDAGHHVHDSAPAEFAAAVLPWLT